MRNMNMDSEQKKKAIIVWMVISVFGAFSCAYALIPLYGKALATKLDEIVFYAYHAIIIAFLALLLYLVYEYTRIKK